MKKNVLIALLIILIMIFTFKIVTMPNLRDFSSLKKEISSGSIISYDMDYLSLNDLLLSFKVITSRGYEIEKLSTLLTE